MASSVADTGANDNNYSIVVVPGDGAGQCGDAICDASVNGAE
jgi:hypothetical protein